VVRASDELAARLALFVVPEVPLDEQVLSLGVTVHALAVATELGVVWGKETKARVNAVDEGLDLLFVTEDHAALPVRGHRPEVDDLDVTHWVDDLDDFCCGDLTHETPYDCVTNARTFVILLDFAKCSLSHL